MNSLNASLTAARSSPTSERTKRPKPWLAWRALDVASLADAGVEQQLLQFVEVRRRQRLALPQLVQHEIVAVGAQEMPRLGLEAGEVGLADLWQGHFDAVADLIGEIGIDDGLSGLLDVLDQVAQPQAHQFQQRHSDAFPPMVGLDFLDQCRVLGDRRDTHLVLQRGRDLQKLLAQGVEPLRPFQQRQLQREHHEVEAFRVLGAEHVARRQ
ncbi:hypothetical protein, partial [Bradyrhizobium sp.]|uniref:hypothetical protein n=1 Tax=Bradyrhizobium sp. TaxID=376 RepID=UPI0025C723DB